VTANPARVLAQARAAAGALMVDACTLTRPAGPRVWDPDTGVYTQPTATVYAGACRVRVRTDAEQVVRAGETTEATWRYLVSLPFTVAAESGDVVQVTASNDPTLPGRVLRVVQVTRGTHVSARRLICEETGR